MLGVHEFHVWQLAGNRIVLSAHITCSNLRDYTEIATTVKDLFHKEGIHSTTIQPEFVSVSFTLYYIFLQFLYMSITHIMAFFIANKQLERRVIAPPLT